MPIVGYNYDDISAARGEKIDVSKLKIDHALNIKEVSIEQTTLADQKQDLMKFSFEFIIDYKPSYGKITLQGHILYTDDNKRLKEVEKQWKKDKKLPEDVTQLILNTILIRSNVKSLMLAQEIGLPPHIPLPIVKPNQGGLKPVGDVKPKEPVKDSKVKSKSEQETEDYIG